MSEQEDYFSCTGGDLYFKRNLSHQNRPRELPGMSEEVIRWAKSYSNTLDKIRAGLIGTSSRLVPTQDIVEAFINSKTIVNQLFYSINDV